MYLPKIGNCVLANHTILFLQISLICGFVLASLAMGERVLNAWLCCLAVAMNLLVMKQITLFGLNVTATDSIAVSYMIGLSLLQEYFGSKAARMHACMATFICAGFTLICVLHNLFTPNQYDGTNQAYKSILGALPRVCMASALTFFVVQLLDINIFQGLRRKLNGQLLALRVLTCVGIAQIIDTVMFSFLGLYGYVEKIWDVILISLMFKLIILILSVPITSICKRIIPNKFDHPFHRSVPSL